MKSKMIMNKNKSLNKFKYILIEIILFLILIAPGVLQEIKAIILAIIVVIILLEIAIKKRLNIHPKILVWVSIYVITNFFFLLRGTYETKDIFSMLAPSYILWPIVYTIALIVASSTFESFDMIKVFIVSTIAVSSYIVYIILNFRGYVPSSFMLLLPLGYKINYDLGYLNFFIPCITSLFFLIPYIIALLLSDKQAMLVKKKYLWLALILGSVASILVGRRTLIGVICVSPFIAVFIGKYKKSISKSIIKKIFIGIVVILLVFMTYFFIGKKLNVKLRIDNSQTTLMKLGTELRFSQFDALIQGWKEKPLLGAGFGINAEGSIRSETTPGMYELSYVAMLFQTGIIGITIYFLLIAWLFKMCVKIIKSNEENSTWMVAILTGVTCMIIANATNPYIQSFDGLWVFFYPLALINRYLTTNVKNEGG